MHRILMKPQDYGRLSSGVLPVMKNEDYGNPSTKLGSLDNSREPF
jgi:hypothetical protein